MGLAGSVGRPPHRVDSLVLWLLLVLTCDARDTETHVQAYYLQPSQTSMVMLTVNGERTERLVAGQVVGVQNRAGARIAHLGDGVIMPAEIRLDRGLNVLVVVPASWPTALGLVTTSLILDATAPSLIGNQFATWRERPVPVVLCTDGEDMTRRVRQAVEGLNAQIGTHELSFAERMSSGCSGTGIIIDVDPALGGRTGVTVLDGTCTGRAGTKHCFPDWLRRARITVAPNAPVLDIQHELLHGLGLRHTCLVESLMATEFSVANLRACGLVRFQAGLMTPITLSRSFSAYDRAALDLLRGLARVVSRPASQAEWVIVN